MSVTILSKDVGDVRDVYRKECGFVWGLEDGIEEYIKLNMGIRE